ncbi:type III-B CRISPR module RAMP protein Cmr1 [Paenibacillus glufosinatiresistens]|uniref:type III-B CRISPR module RAMP protein Cmr1 n=1 Tax=Paenibacillus glufosinatiresistens TaxID=3070657 RepID=UPI00286DD88F|nr:type III-B CRISPR module RAMP protein Cmr1 [Paenibacillus sp. YX.27]
MKVRIQPPPLQELEEQIKRASEAQEYRRQTYSFTIVNAAVLTGTSTDLTQVGDVRATSVRGHLRFWWRATRGAQFRTPGDLKARERLIFGDTSLPSPFRMSVTMYASVKQSSLYRMDSYVAFPYKQKDKADSSAVAFDEQRRRRFDLHLDYGDSVAYSSGSKEPLVILSAEEVRYEIQFALWAWCNFGGVGARTRRGCGSLYCPDFSPNMNNGWNAIEVRKWANDWLEKLPSLMPDESREWPVLAMLRDGEQGLAIQDKPATTNIVWGDTIRLYFKFRQKRNTPKARTHWPEPDAIRRITDWKSEKHKLPFSLDEKSNIAFPRAQFGLPIIFQFKDDSSSSGQEPLKTELNHEDPEKNRLASPLILKPLAISEDRAYGAIIRLLQPPLKSLRLKRVPDRKMSMHTRTKDFDQRLEKTRILPEHIYPKHFISSHYPLKDSGPDAVAGFMCSAEVQNWKKSFRNNKR